MQLSMFVLRWKVKIELRSTLGSQLLQEVVQLCGELKELFLHVSVSPPVAMSHKPYQFVGIHSYLSDMALSLSLLCCHSLSSALPLSPELSAAPCQGNAVN